jgi:hypothetical protein
MNVSVVEGLAALALGVYLGLGRSLPAFIVFGFPAKRYWRNWRTEARPWSSWAIDQWRFVGFMLIVVGLAFLITGRSV